MEVPVIRRTESLGKGADGCSLFRRTWVPARPERVVLLVHGFAEHSGRYEHVGAWLATRGCAVHSYDLRGHGRSAGARGHLRRFDEYLDDLEALLELARSEHEGLPIFVVGHSMGGLIVATFARERSSGVAGFVTSGAALAVGEGESPLRMFALRALRRIAPRLRIKPGFDADQISSDPEVVRAYVEDPLVFTRMTLSLAAELYATAARTSAGGADVKLPMLLLHGEEDTICPFRGSQRFFETLSVPGRAFKSYPKLRHEIFNEPDQATVFEDMLAWISGRKD